MSISAITTGSDPCQAHVEWLHHCYVLKANGDADCFLEFIVGVEKGYTSSIDIYFPYEVKRVQNRTNSLFHDDNKLYYTGGYKLLSHDKDNGELIIDGHRTSIRKAILQLNTTPIGTRLTLSFTEPVSSKMNICTRLAYEVNSLSIKSFEKANRVKYSFNLKYYGNQDAISLHLDNALDINESFIWTVFPHKTEDVYNIVPQQFQQRIYDEYNIKKSVPFYGSKTERIWEKLPRTMVMWALERNDKPVLTKWSSQFFYCDYKLQSAATDRADVNGKSQKITAQESEKLQISYQIWTRVGKNKVSKEEFLARKKNSTLFVNADKRLAYADDQLIAEFENSHLCFDVLVCLLKNKGSITVEKLFRAIYPEKKKVKSIDDMKKNLRTPVYRLRHILDSYKIDLPRLEKGLFDDTRMHYYCLNDAVAFLLTQKDNSPE